MPELFADLIKRVIKPGLCLDCGACVASCPFESLEVIEGTPRLRARCEACGVCCAHGPQVVGPEEIRERIFREEAKASELAGIFEGSFSVRA